MNVANCQCGHEKRDHRAGLAGNKYGACKVCLCDEYVKVKTAAVAAAEKRGPIGQQSPIV